MKRILIATILLSLCICSVAAAQGGFARVSGTVSDSSGAVIPGVTVVATDMNTGVVATQISEESGSFNFASLLPGKYKIAASLTGFQTQTITDLQFGPDQYRVNFTLTLGQAAGVSVDVVESGASILAASSSSVGMVLSQSQVQALPLVGNNVLNLVGLLGGVGNTNQLGTTFGGEQVTFAGVSAANVSTVRDGLMVQDVRYATGITSNTFINPDLVGEIRVILAPVDAEYGRGNGSVQITTRSGTNRYTGSAVLTARNSAFNARTFEQRRASPPGQIPYSNNLQGSVSFGGPIVKNKTFFFVLYDQTSVATRTNVNATVLTPCARNGVFRYFDRWNNGNANQATVEGTSPNPITRVVNLDGSPAKPDRIPNGAPGSFDASGGQLRHVSVFGELLNANSLNADCSNAQVNPARPWDTYRVGMDPSGYVGRMMKYMPLPNNFTTGDGLNTASFSWLRGNEGVDNLFGVGQEAGARKQINVKFDQNFSQNHKANIGVTYERDLSSDSQPVWPGTFAGPAFRHPYTITSSFTSTLSSTIVNEARFGLRYSGSNSTSSYDYEPNMEEINALLPAPVNGVRILPRMGTGGVNFQSTQPFALNQGGQWSYTLRDRSPNYTFTDNVSWTKGQHSFRFGAELRLIRSKGEQNGDGLNFTSIVATGGNGGAPVRTNTGDSLGNTNSDTATFQFLMANDQQRARDLMSFLAGSVGSLSEWFFMMDPKKTDAYEDYRTFPFRERETRSKEIGAFFKDDWKVKKNLTLNLGVRYDYYGVPFIASGLTIAPVGGADALFGISGRSFDNWLHAPAIGPGAVAYDPNLLTQVHFVGPNSQNPDLKAIPPHYRNFAPAIGFAWTPGFGEQRLSIRGGYQLTFSSPQTASAVEGAISNPPGSVVSQTYTRTAGDPDPYMDLTDLGNSAVVPLVTSFNPVQTPPVINRGGGNSYTAYDANTKSPYVQNLTLTVTQNFGRKLSVEARYVGTLSTHTMRGLNLNTNNFLRNPIFQELESIRLGTDVTPILNQMFAGVNTCFTGAGSPNCPTTYVENGVTVPAVYGAVGSTPLQTAAYQMRLNPTWNTSIANGDYAAVMGNLNTYNANLTGPTGSAGRVMRNSGFFPENFFIANPQFNAATFNTNFGHSNYHSLQAQATFNPIQGVTASGTYTFSKGMTLATALSDPLDRSEVTLTGNRPHEFRSNGVIELPIGPNKIILGNSSGWVARLVERWQTSVSLSMSSGQWSNISAVNRMYGTGVPDVVTPVDFNDLKDYTWGNEVQGTQLNGDYFGGDDFVNITDPQCGLITTKQGLPVTTGANPVARCTLRALAIVVDPSTPGAQPLTDFIPTDTTGRSVKIALQNPMPGTKGTLGPNKVKGFGIFSFDLSASKSFRISESKSVQMRIDATNILNHPSPGAPNLDINGNNTFGNITTKTGSRVMQGQLRFSF